MTVDELTQTLNHTCGREEAVDTAKCLRRGTTIVPPRTWHDG